MHIIDDTELLEFKGRQESQFLLKPSELSDAVIERLSSDGILHGDKLPWQKTHNCVVLRKGEVSIWAGINGHGKSLLLGQVCLWLQRSSKWLIASMEMAPAATMERMSKQAAGCNPSHDYVRNFLSWTDEKLWIYDQSDSVESDRILAVIYFAAMKYQVNHVVIDSLLKCGIDDDDYNKQKVFVDKLCWLAKDTGVHIHLVAHMRKGKSEDQRPGKFDVLGSSAITNLVDNLFIVHRNISKERKVRKKEEVDIEEPDCTLTIAKQRHGEWEGTFRLWFHRESNQYIPSPQDKAMMFNM